MFTHRGIGIDSFAKIESDCPMTCEVVGNEAQFEFGHATHCLNLVITEQALHHLAAVVADALAKFADDLPPTRLTA
ncbi:hypothetical protein [Actinokineospora sp.]|uniref:hypothetical protein n=1 Tax=Actinokineospora sp. TaxID=1872133 RepID=UPI0040383A81